MRAGSHHTQADIFAKAGGGGGARKASKCIKYVRGRFKRICLCLMGCKGACLCLVGCFPDRRTALMQACKHALRETKSILLHK